MNSTNEFALMSYNSTGFNKFKGKFINDLLISNKIKVLAIQEHMHLAQNVHKIQEHFPDFELFAIPAFKANTQINKGRPSCGLGFLFENNLSNCVVKLVCPFSNRVQGLKLNLNSMSYVFINVYFPVDKRNNDIDELIKVLQDIKYILNLCDDNCKIIVLGDLNLDFSRDSYFSNYGKQFCIDNDLNSVWTKFNCDYTYSHTKIVNGLSRTYFSIIDHFCVKNDFLKDCVEAFPIHTPDNIYNHEPILLKFNCVDVI